MTDKHTPGPWHVNTDSGQLPRVCDANGYGVAHMSERPRHGRSRAAELAERAANAHLTAAAPAMLAALRDIVAAFPIAGDDAVQDMALQAAHAAIAKAIGETP